MTTNTAPSTQLQSLSSEIAGLRRELVTADAKLRGTIRDRIIALRANRDSLRHQAVDATNQEIARLESDRVIAEHAVTVARGSARTQAEAKLGQIRSGLTRHQDALQAHVAAIAHEADDQVAMLKTQAAAAAGPARHQLEKVADQLWAKRDAVTAKAVALRGAAAAEWQAAKSEFDASLRELAAIDSDHHLAGGRDGK
jgi:hypothetical protein